MEPDVITMDPCMIMNGMTMSASCNKTTTGMDMGKSTMSGMDMGTSQTPGMSMPGMNMTSMLNYFHWGYEETILFSFWKINTIGGLIGSMALIFVGCIVYEGLKTFRDIVARRSFKSRHKKNGNKFRLSLFFDWKYTLLSVLQGILLSLSYGFMLIFMTFNSWLSGTVVFGLSVGYFFFGWITPETDDCC